MPPIRSRVQFEIYKQIKNLTGVKPLEVTITNSGVSLVFDNHADYASVYRFFRCGDGKETAQIIDVDFDQGLRFLVLKGFIAKGVA